MCTPCPGDISALLALPITATWDLRADSTWLNKHHTDHHLSRSPRATPAPDSHDPVTT